MPNWCSTSITIRSEHTGDVQRLYELIREWTSKNQRDNGFGNDWLGNIVLGAGIGGVEGENSDYFFCRGSITNIDYDNDGTLDIWTETAWAPALKMWHQIADKYVPDNEITYIAEECGSELYCTNDPNLSGMYVFSNWSEDYDIFPDSDDEYSHDYIVQILQQALQSNETDIDVLLDEFGKRDEYEDIYIHQWEYVDIEEWE